MAKRSSDIALRNALLLVIAFLLGIIFLMFQPSHPTESGDSGGTIPLGNGSIQSPTDIQGNRAVSPQQAAPLKREELNDLNI